MASRASPYRPQPPARIDQRRAPRERLSVSRAAVRRHSMAAIDAVLGDISVYGCRIGCDERFLTGERVWLRFAGTMPLAATVVWSERGEAGCRFDVPIARALMRTLVLVDRC